MKTRVDLIDWIVEALKGQNGSATIRNVCTYIWEHHQEDLRISGNLHFTWQDDIHWAVTQLRAKGILKKAKETQKSVWALCDKGMIDKREMDVKHE